MSLRIVVAIGELNAVPKTLSIIPGLRISHGGEIVSHHD